MAPLIALALELAPHLIPSAVRALGGDKAAETAEKVLDIAKQATGLDDNREAVDAIKRDPAAQLQLQTLLSNERIEFERLSVRREEIAADDRKSARSMYVETRDMTPAALSWIIVGFTLAIEGYILTQGVPEAVDPLITGRVLGTLDAALIAVISFWLGSSANSKAKDETIGRMAGR